MTLSVPEQLKGLFAYFRFAFPICDALRATTFPQMLGVAEGTILRNAGVVTSDDIAALRKELARTTGATIPEGSIQPDMRVAQLCLLLAEHAEAPTPDEVAAFYREFPGMQPEA